MFCHFGNALAVREQLVGFRELAHDLIGRVLRFNSFSASRVNLLMLGLVVLAAVPWSRSLSQTSTCRSRSSMSMRDRTIADSSPRQLHPILVGVVAGVRADGWRPTAWVAGLLPVLLALISMIYPDRSSSIDLVWAFAATAWDAAFVAATELTKNGENTTSLGLRAVVSKSGRA